MTLHAYLKSRCSHQLHREAWRAAFDALERGEACESTKLSLRIPAFGGFFAFAAPSHAIRDPPLSVVIIADALRGFSFFGGVSGVKNAVLRVSPVGRAVAANSWNSQV